MSEELDRGGRPPEEMSKAERSAAWLLWDESSNHYEEYADEDRLPFHRLVPSAELVVVALVVLFFGGGYLGFIAWLALTR